MAGQDWWRERHPEGPVVCRAAGGGTAERLRRSARLLSVASHPQVVPLVAVDDDGDSVRLVTGDVGGSTLAEVAPSGHEAARLVASLATVVADLHDLGVVHGSLAPEHVIVTSSAAVLCGFGSAGTVGEAVELGDVAPPFVPPEVGDPARGPVPLDPAMDVFALGVLIRHVRDCSSSDATGDGPGLVWETLEQLADRACDERPAARPGARWLADATADATTDWSPGGAGNPPSGPPAGDPTATAPVRSLTRRSPASSIELARRRAGSGRRPGMVRAAAVLAVGAIGVGLVAGLGAVGSTDGAPAASPPPTEPLAPPASSSPARFRLEPGPRPTPAPPAPSPAPGGSCDRVGSAAADTDGDGCPEDVAFADGLVTAGGRTWAVGAPGDAMVVGDWTCTGQRTLALFRPTTGVVYRFDSWPGPGEVLEAVPSPTQVIGGWARVGDLDGDGCHELVVEGGDVLEVAIDLAPVRSPGGGGR